MNDLNLTLSTNDNEVILREGQALPVAHPKPITICGTLQAPFQFLQGKSPDASKAHLRIQEDKGILELHIEDTNPHSEIVITGQLKKDTTLESWKINTEKRWSVAEFLKHIKTQRYFFSTKEEHASIVESLQKWNAKIETVISQHNDNSGNSLSMLEKKVGEVQLKNKFSLTIPIFQGYPNQKFTVEIGLDPKSNSVDLFLISDDLFELEIEHRINLLRTELAKFKDFNCSKVVLS